MAEAGSSQSSAILRPAQASDAARLAEIYAPHVLHGTATFEEVPPGATLMAERLAGLIEGGYPWLVAEIAGLVVGYAYAGPYHRRSAYRFTVEDSIYIEERHQRQGIGRLLLARLADECAGRGFRQMMAVIGDSGNEASVGLHAALGFREIGRARHIGFKFNRHIDVVFMQRSLASEES